MSAIFSDFSYFEIKPEMRDVLAKMRECGKQAKTRDFPHDRGTVDTYDKRRENKFLCTSYIVNSDKLY